MLSESVETRKELSKQLHNDGSPREDEREVETSREYHRSNFERERKHDSLSRNSSRYQPYTSSKSDRESRLSKRDTNTKLYVYNLPYSLKWQELKDHMKKGPYF